MHNGDVCADIETKKTQDKTTKSAQFKVKEYCAALKYIKQKAIYK